MGFETAAGQGTDKKGLSNAEVLAVENKLECSPSQHQSTSNYGGKARIIRNSGSTASGSITPHLEVGGKRKRK